MSTVTSPFPSPPLSPPSDYYELDQLLTARDREIRYAIRQYAHTHLTRTLLASCYESAEFPHQVIHPLASLQLCGLDISRQWGAPQTTAVSSGVAALELGRVSQCVATFFAILQPISMMAIAKCGSEEQKQRYLPDMAALNRIGCFGLTEPAAGSDASRVTTRATPVYNSDGTTSWILNGQKRWIGNGTFADIFIIWAKNTENKQIHGFIVEKGTPGLRTEKIHNKLALRMVQNADIYLDKVQVSESQRLPLTTDFATGPGRCLFLTRVMAGWIAVGGCMGAFDACLSYVMSRHQFGSPLAQFQITQERLMRALGMIQSMILMSWRVSQAYDQRTLTMGQAALAKAHNTSTGRDVLSLLREMMGGNGVLHDHVVMRMMADIEGVHTFEGTYDVNVLVAAREITSLGSFKAPHGSKTGDNKIGNIDHPLTLALSQSKSRHAAVARAKL